MWYTHVQSPVGRLLVAADREGLRHVAFAGRLQPQRGWSKDAGPLRPTLEQLDEYFAGDRKRFRLKVVPEGTPFRRRIWSALLSVHYGRTLSYGELAAEAGRPGAARAAGSAVGANPISIVIPCHRILGADGSLTGFGGGLNRKKVLLGLEGIKAA